MQAVDQHDARAQAARSVDGRLAEGRSGDEDALVGLLQAQSAVKVADRAGADVVAFGVALGLHEDLVDAERVLVDDAIDAVITALPKRTAGLFRCAAVAHGQQQLDDQLLEERRRGLAHEVQQVGGQGAGDGTVGLAQGLVRSLGADLGAEGCRHLRWRCGGGAIGLVDLGLEVLELLELVEVGVVDRGRGIRQGSLAA